jgi:hypothetical protein
MGEHELSKDVLHALKDSDGLGRLNPEQRLQFYIHECQRMGLDPASRPLGFMTLHGKVILYADRRCADMLAAKYGVSTEIKEGPVQKKFGKDEVIFARARAIMPNGRYAEDVGSVSLNDPANGLMKVVSKAMRRAILRLCGWGGLDESEVDSIRGAVKFDPEDPVPQTEPPPSEARPAATALTPSPSRPPPAPPPSDPPLEPIDAIRSAIKQASLSERPGYALRDLAPKVLELNDPIATDAYADAWVKVIQGLQKPALPFAYKAVSELPPAVRATDAWAPALAIFQAEGLLPREPGSDDGEAPRDAA